VSRAGSYPGTRPAAGYGTDAAGPSASAPETRTEVQIRYARGEGTVLEGDGAPFHDVLVRTASGAEVREWLQRSEQGYAKLQLGELALVAGAPCMADASGFDRHTFLCGQSGSGKTYSLGVILEQLLIETDLRMVVLDPNSDFGDITPKSQPARIVLIVQMLGDLAVLGAGVRVLLGAVRRGRQRRTDTGDEADSVT
jgi:Helicase HerA, central domain